MGEDIHVHILKRKRNTNKWKEVILYGKNEKESTNVINLYPFRNYELFETLKGNMDNSYKAYPIEEHNLPESLKEEYKEDCKYCYGFKEINFAELKLYVIKHPVEEQIKYFYERIKWYLDFADENFDFTPLSDYKILYWFDN